MPQSMPIYPNKAVVMTLSVMMSFRMCHGLAPIAFLTPNSRVRYFTVISMMFDTPTMPLRSVNRPIIHNAERMMAMPVVIWILSI